MSDSDQSDPKSFEYIRAKKPQQVQVVPYDQDEIRQKKVLCGVFGILLGMFGIHKFILGYTSTGLIMLLVTILTFGVCGVVMGIIGLIEGILYLTASEAQFYETYMVGRKDWF